MEFIGSAKLVIHNAMFDMKFINAELIKSEKEEIPFERATDTLAIARKKYPGSPASLDLFVEGLKLIIQREWYGALLDSQILAKYIWNWSEENNPISR